MKTEFIPYEQALALKELGFDYQCVNYYSHYGNGQVHLNNLVLCSKIGVETNNDKGILAPLYQQAFRWFRENYGYLVSTFNTEFIIHKEYSKSNTLDITNGAFKPIFIRETIHQGNANNYEEAELACLIRLVEIVKKK
jgi:hypothetical protein